MSLGAKHQRAFINERQALKLILCDTMIGYSVWSDIDLAAWGIPPERFFAAVAAMTGLSADT